MTGSSFADVRPYPLSRNPGAPSATTATAAPPGPEPNNSAIGRGNLNSNNHMAQSHPHLYASNPANNSSSTQPTAYGMEVSYPSVGANMMGAAGPLFYSQQELQHFQNFQQSGDHHQQPHHPHFQQQPSHQYHAGVPMSSRSGSSRSRGSHHSRSYQNLPSSSQQQLPQQYGVGAGGSSSINQPFNTTSSSQQQLYNQQHHKQVSLHYSHGRQLEENESALVFICWLPPFFSLPFSHFRSLCAVCALQVLWFADEIVLNNL